MRKSLALLLFVFIPLTLETRAPAQSKSPVRKLSLKRSIELALQKNTAIKEAGDDVKIAKAQLAQARSGYFPRVNVMAGSVIMEESQKFSVPPGNISFDLSAMGFPALPGIFDPSKPISNSDTLEIPITDQWINFGLISFTQPVFTGGMITGYNRMAKSGLRVAKHGKTRTRHQVIRTVVRRYNDVLLTEQLFKLGESTLKKLEVVLDITKRVFEAGSQKVNKLDLLQTKIFVASLESFVETLRQSRKLAAEGLKFAIGLDGKASIAPSSSTFLLAPVKLSCDQNVQKAMRSRPEVGQLKNGIKALQAGVDVAWSRYLPDLALTGGYMIDDNSIRFTDGHTFFTGLVLNFNLFEGFMTGAKVSEAKARVNKLKHKERYLAQGVSLQVRKACMDVGRARRQVEITEKALRAAEEHLELSENGYQADLVEMEDLLKAQLMEAAMQAQHVTARYNLSNYLLDLRVSTGDLSEYYRKGR